MLMSSCKGHQRLLDAKGRIMAAPITVECIPAITSCSVPSTNHGPAGIFGYSNKFLLRPIRLGISSKRMLTAVSPV